MCGQAGAWRDWDDEIVPRMLDRISHRGPDGDGVAEQAGAVHGHVRLAIIDPHPRSGQPFARDGGLLTFVGEVWNWRELRAVLEDEGEEFVTEGDTEVLAAALARYGVRDALPKLEGMFTFAWTDADGETWLARDRFGKVPLYVVERSHVGGEDAVLWASERKAFGSWAGAAQPLPPGWVWQLGGVPESWYTVPLDPLPDGSTSAQNVLRQLRTGVKQRLQADVPVCCLVSGGLDSSLVLALVQEQKPDVIAYTAVPGDFYGEPPGPDLEMAVAVCEYLGVEHRIVETGWPTRDEYAAAVRAIEVTTKTQVEIATLCLPLAERISADGFKVCLSGEAADELFGGYGTLARWSRSDKLWREKRREFLAKMGRSDFIRVNKAFMAHGVEARLPFMHRPLVEHALNLGVKDCPVPKKLLQRAARGLLPNEVVDRRKVTFQGGAGIKFHTEALFESPRKEFNDMAREVFNVVTVG